MLVYEKSSSSSKYMKKILSLQKDDDITTPAMFATYSAKAMPAAS